MAKNGETHLDVDPKENRRLVRPAARHIAQGVATTSKNEGRDAEALYELDAVGVALQAQIKAPQTVP